jgi:hypothetical protein
MVGRGQRSTGLVFAPSLDRVNYSYRDERDTRTFMIYFHTCQPRKTFMNFKKKKFDDIDDICIVRG